MRLLCKFYASVHHSNAINIHRLHRNCTTFLVFSNFSTFCTIPFYLFCAFCFLVSLLAAPIFLAIPGFATAPALVVVGFLMIKSITYIDLNDIASAIPAYILMVSIVFTYSISDGLGLGVISYTVLNCRSKGKINWILWVISLLFVVKYLCF